MSVMFRAIAMGFLFLLLPRVAWAEPLRIVVSVGHRLGVAGEAPLKHAEKDATRFRDVFVQLGGVAPDSALLLREPNAAQLFAAIDKASALARTRHPSDVTLIFYFSGHGDRENIHLGAERVSLKDVDARLAQSSAAVRMLVVDACRSIDTRGKGIIEDEPFAVTVDSTGSGASGVIKIQASAEGEVAQESDELGGAIFTYYWLTGLSGAADADGDGRVTLSEAYSFAFHQTLYRSSRSSGVVQRPAAEFDLKEAAPLVLTQTAAAASAIKLPRAPDVHYLIYALGSHTVVGELWSSPDRVVSLAVAPGKYIVQRRGGGAAAAVQIDVARGESREVKGNDFRAVSEEMLARKGGEMNLRPDEWSIGYALGTSRWFGLGHELALRYGHEWDSGFALDVGLLGGLGTHHGDAQSSSLKWTGLEALVEQRFRVGRFVLRTGVGPRMLGILQKTTRNDADRLALAGYDGISHARAMMVGGQILAGARLPLSHAFWIALDLRGEVLAGRLDGTAAAFIGGSAGTSIGLSF